MFSSISVFEINVQFLKIYKSGIICCKEHWIKLQGLGSVPWFLLMNCVQTSSVGLWGSNL